MATGGLVVKRCAGLPVSISLHLPFIHRVAHL